MNPTIPSKQISHIQLHHHASTTKMLPISMFHSYIFELRCCIRRVAAMSCRWRVAAMGCVRRVVAMSCVRRVVAMSCILRFAAMSCILRFAAMSCIRRVAAMSCIRRVAAMNRCKCSSIRQVACGHNHWESHIFRVPWCVPIVSAPTRRTGKEIIGPTTCELAQASRVPLGNALSVVKA
jgi:hypothetical protein